MAWSISIKDMGFPGLDHLKISFTLLRDGVNYINDEVRIASQLLIGKTLQEKKDFIKSKIQDKCTSYVDLANTKDDVESIGSFSFNLSL